MGEALQPGEYVMITNQSHFYSLRCVVNAVHNDLVHVTPLPLQIVGLSHQFEKTPPIKTYEESVNEDYENMVRLLNPLNSTYRLGDIVSINVDGAIVVATIINIDSDVMFQAVDFQNNIIQTDYKSILENLKDDGSCVDMYGNRIFLDDVITIKEGIYTDIQATVCHTYQHSILCLTFGDERQYYACQDTNTMLGESPKCQVDFSDLDLNLILADPDCKDPTGKPITKYTNVNIVKPTQDYEDYSSISADQPFPDDSEIQWTDPIRSTLRSPVMSSPKTLFRPQADIPASPKVVPRPNIPSIPGFPNASTPTRSPNLNQSYTQSPQMVNIYQQNSGIPNRKLPLPPPPSQNQSSYAPPNQNQTGYAPPKQKSAGPPKWLIEGSIVRVKGSDIDAVVSKVYPNYCVVQNITKPGKLGFNSQKVSFDNVEKYDICVGQKVIVINSTIGKHTKKITGKVRGTSGDSVRIMVDTKGRQVDIRPYYKDEVVRLFNWEDGDEEDEI